MNIQKCDKTTFRGYDARPLKGFIMNANSYGIAKEMQTIGKKEGFKIYAPLSGDYSTLCGEVLPAYKEDTAGVWAQDLWTVVKNKLLAFELSEKTYAIKKFFDLDFDFTQKTVRENPRFLALNEKVWNLAGLIATSKQDSEDLPFLMFSFEANREKLKDFQHTFHIPGGNIYVVKGDNGDEAFVGEKELEKYSIDEIKAMYCVNKVIPLPQMDYHIDLFIRPLDNKRVLLADDELNIEVLQTLSEKLNDLIRSKKTAQERNQYKHVFVKLNSVLTTEKQLVQLNPLAKADEVAEVLEKNGYEPIRIPARVYEIAEFAVSGRQFPLHYCNYINANVLKNKNGELVYITNKSNIDKMLGLTPELIEELGYSYEQEFVKRLSQYVKEEHIYFVKGTKNFVAEQMLTEYQGGIHCACSEVPIEENSLND